MGPESESSQYGNSFLTFGIYCKFKSHLYQNYLATEIFDVRGMVWQGAGSRKKEEGETARFGSRNASKKTTGSQKFACIILHLYLGFTLHEGAATSSNI